MLEQKCLHCDSFINIPKLTISARLKYMLCQKIPMDEKKKYFASQTLTLIYSMSVRKYDIWKSKNMDFLSKCQLTLQEFFHCSPEQTVILFYRTKNYEVTVTSRMKWCSNHVCSQWATSHHNPPTSPSTSGPGDTGS